MKNFFSVNKNILYTTIASIIALEFFSFYGFIFPVLNTVFFLFIITGTLLLSWKKVEYGIFIAIAELIISSKGYLFYITIDQKTISVRIAIFISIMIIWSLKTFISFLKTKKINIEFTRSILFYPYLFLFLTLLLGLMFGFLNKNSLSNIFLDFNGWLYFLLVFPIYDAIKKENLNDLFSVILGAITMLVLKTTIILFIFSHNSISVIPQIYKWIRVTGVGEITNIGHGFYRIFFQSHIYSIIGFFTLFPLLNKKIVHNKESIKKNKFLFLMVVLLLSTATISFSRSFWVGLVVTILFFYFFLFFKLREKIKNVIASSLLLLVLLVVSVYFTASIVIASSVFTKKHVSFISALGDRTAIKSEEAAIGSRWNLLNPLFDEMMKKPITGSGFGTTVTYNTLDPRALESNDSGLYTSYAFEWGYMDMWLKIGILGLSAYFYLLYKIVRIGLYNYKSLFILGSIFGVISLSVVHFFTPYLNHPLGIGYILLTGIVFELVHLHKNKKKC